MVHLRHALEVISCDRIDFDEVKIEVPFRLYHKLWYTMWNDLGPPMENVEMSLSFKLAGITFVTQLPPLSASLQPDQAAALPQEAQAVPEKPLESR